MKIKKILLPVLIKTSIRYFDLFRADLLKNSLTVFVYHDISDEPSEFSAQYDLNVSPEMFEYQINLIKKRFNLISPKDLYSPDLLPEKAALITFDDGFKSIFNTALPILEKYKIPSTIFLNMGPVKGEVFWSGLITYLCAQPDFIKYLKSQALKKKRMPLFLHCSKSIVDAYLKNSMDLNEDVNNFVGEFASIMDLHNSSKSDLVFLGNHLYNHFIPKLMSDDEFIETYKKNDLAIKKFSNYINMFSFPFGQPGTCFQKKHIDLLFEMGVGKIFRSSESVNYCVDSLNLDRISLTENHNTEEKIYFQIIKHRLLKKKFNY